MDEYIIINIIEYIFNKSKRIENLIFSSESSLVWSTTYYVRTTLDVVVRFLFRVKNVQIRYSNYIWEQKNQNFQIFAEEFVSSSLSVYVAPCANLLTVVFIKT